MAQDLVQRSAIALAVDDLATDHGQPDRRGVGGVHQPGVELAERQPRRVEAREREVGRRADGGRSAADQLRPLARGDLPRLGGGDGRRVGGDVLLDESERLHVVEQVEGVVGAGTVGAQADLGAGSARGRVGEHPADRELLVGDRVRDHRRPTLDDQLDLGLVEPDAVGEQRARPQHPGPVQVMGGPQPGLSDAVHHLLLGLGEVDLDRDVALLGDLRDPAQRGLGDGVDRMRRQGRAHRALARLLDLVERAARLREQLRRLVGVLVVDQRRADDRAQPGVLHRPSGRGVLPVRGPRTGSSPRAPSPGTRAACPSRRPRARVAARRARCTAGATPSTAGRRRSRGRGSSPRACGR